MTKAIALDSGAVIGVANGKRAAIALLKALVAAKTLVVVPVPVLAETLRGGNADANVYRVIKNAKLAPLTAESAKDAGARLGFAKSGETVDAMIVAIASEQDCYAIATGDPGDLAPLVDGAMDIVPL